MSVELSNAQQFISWMNTKSYLNSIASNAANRFVKRRVKQKSRSCLTSDYSYGIL